MEPTKRNGIIDFMRFVFCMVIILYHCRNMGGTSDIALCADAGYIAVEFFFLVSGFLMAKSAAKRNDSDYSHLGTETTQFLWHKIKPILPYYVFAVVLSYSCTAFLKNYTAVQALHNLMLGIWNLFFLGISGIRTFSLLRATWYLSAMFISMLILYPMLCKWKDRFTHIVAPLIVIFLLGWLSQTYGNLNQYTVHFDLVYSGLVRALAEISLGCICFAVYKKIKTIQFTIVARTLITLIQLFGYTGVIYCTTNLPSKQFDFVMLLCLAVCITLSFSGHGIFAHLFGSKLFPWLGKLSLVMYLNHMWVKDTIVALLPKSIGYWKLLSLCIICVLLVSLLCLLWTKGQCIFWSKLGTKIKTFFIK